MKRANRDVRTDVQNLVIKNFDKKKQCLFNFTIFIVYYRNMLSKYKQNNYHSKHKYYIVYTIH